MCACRWPIIRERHARRTGAASARASASSEQETKMQRPGTMPTAKAWDHAKCSGSCALTILNVILPSFILVHHYWFHHKWCGEVETCFNISYVLEGCISCTGSLGCPVRCWPTWLVGPSIHPCANLFTLFTWAFPPCVGLLCFRRPINKK